MAEKTYIVKLAGDSKSYQQSMSQASKALDQYQKQNLSTGAAVKSLTSTLTKYVSVAALVKGAQETITKTIQGSQASADKWAETIHACKVVVDNFFSSLSTGDFTSFNMGLNQMIANAKLAAQALDVLGNASMSWNYFQSARMADLTELSAVMNDTTAPLSQRKAAAQSVIDIQGKMQGYAAGFEERALKAMATKMTEATMIEWSNVTREDLEKILQLDLLPSTFSEQRKNELDAQYKEYQSKMAALKADFDKNYKRMERVQTGVSQNGLPLYSVVDRTKPEDYERYNNQMRALASEYQDVILYNEALVRKSNEWLQELIQIVQMADNAARSMRRVNTAAQTATGVLNMTGESVPVQPRSLGTLPAAALPAAAGIMEVPEMDYQTQLPEINTGLQNINGSLTEMSDNLDSVSTGFQSMAAASDGVNSLGRSVEQIGAAFSSFGSSGIGNTIGAIGSAIQAYAQLAASAASAAAAEGALETPTIWGKITALGSFAVAYTSMVSTMKSISDSYAEGGVIPGQNYNDGITARVSSGEMIINEADQKRLYDSIHSGSVGGGGGSASITGEQIVIAVNNYGRRTNRGELVFAGRG